MSETHGNKQVPVPNYQVHHPHKSCLVPAREVGTAPELTDGTRCSFSYSVAQWDKTNNKTGDGWPFWRAFLYVNLLGNRAPQRTHHSLLAVCEWSWGCGTRVWGMWTPAALRPRTPIVAVPAPAMIGPKVTVVVVVFALLYSLYSLKHCVVTTLPFPFPFPLPLLFPCPEWASEQEWLFFVLWGLYAASYGKGKFVLVFVQLARSCVFLWTSAFCDGAHCCVDSFVLVYLTYSVVLCFYLVARVSYW